MASGRAHRMAGILQMIIDQAKTRIAVEVDPKRIRPADESLLLGDTRKIREALGWHPIMDLRRAIRRILEYWRKHASRAAAARSIMIEPLRRNKAAGEMNGGSIPRTSRQLVDNGAINDTRAGARLCKTAQIVPALDSGDARRRLLRRYTKRRRKTVTSIQALSDCHLVRRCHILQWRDASLGRSSRRTEKRSPSRASSCALRTKCSDVKPARSSRQAYHGRRLTTPSPGSPLSKQRG